ncbi:MAG: group III truncated hemoglobin [Flavobacteriaceae bacterium]|jgi:hemoglobin|nr:group III truncated hemoglobin [Flavobacteriaceae bacterium]
MKKDIQTLEDIVLLVDTFYGRVQQNELIGPIFNEKLEGRWPEHLQKMYQFWQTVLLEEFTYKGRPFPPHAQLPVEALHFETWKGIFNATVDEFFEGPIAEEAKWRGDRMGKMFLSKIEYFRGYEGEPQM